MTTETLTLDGIDLPIRPTPLVELTKVIPGLGQGINTPEGADALAIGVFHGIRRAKGEVTLDFVRSAIDMSNAFAVFEVFCRVNGLDQKATSTGEAAAG